MPYHWYSTHHLGNINLCSTLCSKSQARLKYIWWLFSYVFKRGKKKKIVHFLECEGDLKKTS